MQTNCYFCNCLKQKLWASAAYLSKVWYNWPKVLEDFNSVDGCVEAYLRFAIQHRYHKDQICFKASVFAVAGIGLMMQGLKFSSRVPSWRQNKHGHEDICQDPL